MIMRPDERAVESEIARDRQFRSNVGKAAKTVVGAAGAAGAAVATGVSSKVLPWLSSYIPTDLAMKGLQKVSPKLADFLKRGQNAGLDVRQGMDYVKDKISPKTEEQQEEQAEQTKEDRNIIEQYSPELHQFIAQQVASGRDPIQAGALAQNDKRFASVINKLSQDHKTPWSSILQSVYGAGERPGALQKSGNSGQQQQPGQQQENSDQIIVDLLKDIDSKLG